VDKKPNTIEEPRAAYAASKRTKKPASAPSKASTTAEFDRIAGKLFSERKQLLHRLAQ